MKVSSIDHWSTDLTVQCPTMQVPQIKRSSTTDIVRQEVPGHHNDDQPANHPQFFNFSIFLVELTILRFPYVNSHETVNSYKMKKRGKILLKYCSMFHPTYHSLYIYSSVEMQKKIFSVCTRPADGRFLCARGHVL